MRNKNKQLAINMLASFFTFLVGLGIRFLLTPYIVKSLGPEAYGFTGLAANILSYTSLVTIALNSMAARFITVSYVSGKTEEANQFFSSVFYSNLVLGSVILLFSIGCVIWLEYIIHIPKELVSDVKFLFVLLAVNNIIGLITNVWGIATFIKNRLDLSNIRGIIGNAINATTLILLFSCFIPHIWYMGVAGMLLTLYTSIANKKLTDMLTPDLVINTRYFQWSKVKELLSSGVWNLVSKLGEILGHGLDLLIANLCISVAAMGYFALTKNLPFLILSLFQMIANVFAPTLTSLYAKNDKGEMIRELNKSIRILCVFTAIPVVALYVYGDSFYALWLPSEDARRLQLITILGTLALPFTLPLESLWNIFTVTNKLKYSTLFMLFNNVVVFCIVMTSMFVFDSMELRLLILAGTRSICGILRGLFFLPMYGAYCLEQSVGTFYKVILRSLLCTTLCLGASMSLRLFINAKNWPMLFVAITAVSVVCLAISNFTILTKHDRTSLLSMVRRRLK